MPTIDASSKQSAYLSTSFFAGTIAAVAGAAAVVIFFFSIFLVLFSTPCIASQSSEADMSFPWKLVKNKRGIKVFTRSVKDSKYHEFKGVVEFKASFASVLGLLNDTGACKDWFQYCEESRTLSEVKYVYRYIYQMSDMPFPIANRDVIFKASVTWDEDTGAASISLQSQPDYLPPTKYIRIRNSYGAYLVEPVADETVRLTWTQFIDPGGKVPVFLVNSMLPGIPYKSLINFRKLVKHPVYRDLEFQRDESGEAVDFKD